MLSRAQARSLGLRCGNSDANLGMQLFGPHLPRKMILQLSEEVPPELFKTLLYREQVSSSPRRQWLSDSLSLIPLLHHDSVSFNISKWTDAHAVMRMRCVCKKLRIYIESLPNLRLKLSRKGATEANAMFFSHFKSLCISSYWGWEDGWLVAAVAAASTGSLCIESLSIAPSDRSLLGLVLIMKESLPHTIKKIALSLHGLAYSFKSSVRCIKTLASIVGSIDIEIRLAVNEDLDLPDDINHAFDILADIATCKSLHMQCEPPLDSHISFSISALRIKSGRCRSPRLQLGAASWLGRLSSLQDLQFS